MLKHRIIVGFLFLFFIVFIPQFAFSADISLQLGVNDDDIDGRIDIFIYPNDVPLSIGAGFLNSKEDDYWLTNVNMALKDNVFVSGLNLGLGFKGVYGESEILGTDYDIAAIGFQFLFEYDFRDTFQLPININAETTFAPSALSTKDTDKYFEFYTSVNFHVNDWAALFVGFRKIEVDFEKDRTTRELSDDSIYFGVKFDF